MRWRLAFPKAMIYHLGAVNSDHCPILLDTNLLKISIGDLFHFEATWTRMQSVLRLSTMLGWMNFGALLVTNSIESNLIHPLRNGIEKNLGIANLEFVSSIIRL